MKPKQIKKAKMLLSKFKKMEEKVLNSIAEICELSNYKESSLFSFNKDRFLKFIEDLEYSVNAICEDESIIIGNKLTDKGNSILTKFGYPKEDLQQIERALKFVVLEDEERNKLTKEDAIKMLGEEVFLSGIGRAAFHYTAGRGDEGKNYVCFNCSKMFK